MREPLVCIVVLNWNGKEVLKNCLNSLLKKTDYKNYRIVVVDNGSTDGSVDMIKRNFKKIDVIANKENLGFTKGNNVGIRYSLNKYSPDYVILLNNDTLIAQKGWLKKLVDVAESDRKIGVVGPKLIFPDSRIQWAARRKESNAIYLMIQTLSASLNPGVGMKKEESTFVGEANTVSGACMMIKSELLKKIGLIDESLSPFYQEDVEYSFRAWKAGYKVIYVGNSEVIHLQSYSFRKRGISDENLYLAMRNSTIVARRYFGFLTTFFIGLPILIITAFFERRDKTLGFSIRNLRIRRGLFSKILIILKILKYVIIKKDIE
jgi:GT2 family glycosyltransferase